MSIGAAAFGVGTGGPPRWADTMALNATTNRIESFICRAASYAMATLKGLPYIWVRLSHCHVCSAALSGPRRKALVDRLYKHAGRPRAGVGTVARRISRRRLRGLDLLERHALLAQVLNAIANDRHHVAVVDDVELIAETAMPRDDVGAAVLRDERDRRNREIHEPVERVDFALHAAAARDVDDRKPRRVEHVARCHDIGSAEEDDAVTVGVRRRLMQHLDAFSVEVHVLPLLVVGFCRPRGGRKRRRLSCRRAHPRQHFFC